MSLARYLTTRKKNTEVISTFAGLNENITASANEFAATTNMTSDCYPSAASRKSRGAIIETASGIKAFMMKNGKVFKIVNNKAYYDGTEICSVSTTYPKTLVAMGAYIIIFPDKKRYNTADGTVDSLAAHYENVGYRHKIYADLLVEEGTYEPTSVYINTDGVSGTYSILSMTDDYIEVELIPAIGTSRAVNTSTTSDFTLSVATGSTAREWEHRSLADTTGWTAHTTTHGTVYTKAATEPEEADHYVAVTTIPIETTPRPVTFAPLSSGSVFTKITESGLGTLFKTGDGITIADCTCTENDFNGTHVISEAGNGYIVIPGQITTTFTQTTAMTIDRAVPDMDYIIERDNRLWGCSSDNHEVYSCMLDDPTNWNVFEGTSADAYAATVASDGDFTGIAKYSSYLIFFKESRAHILRGDKPANYSLTEKEMAGVRAGCDKSITTIADTLFYVSNDGVYAFSGGQPQKASGALRKALTQAKASHYNEKLYLSCKADGTDTLYTYDTRTSLWLRESGEVLSHMQYADGKLYYVDESDRITTIEGSRSETISYSLESVDINESSMAMKYISGIRLNLWLGVGAYVNVYTKFDDGAWKLISTIRSAINKTYSIPITPNRCGKWRYKLEGTGEFKLLAMSRDVEGGSYNNGNLFSQYRH